MFICSWSEFLILEEFIDRIILNKLVPEETFINPVATHSDSVVFLLSKLKDGVILRWVHALKCRAFNGLCV